MKKFTVGIVSLALLLGLGTAVFAAGNSDSVNGFTFEKILPFMEKMHPNSSESELENMYKSCQGNKEMINGMNSKNMMN
jgi:hypothetical protein